MQVRSRNVFCCTALPLLLCSFGLLRAEARVADETVLNLAQQAVLVQLDMEHNDKADTLQNVHLALPIFPPDSSLYAAFAAFLEGRGRSKEALELWQKTLLLDSTLEPAHYGVAHLMLDLGDAAGAMRATEAGLRAAPKSARLYLARSRAEEALGLWYQSRRTLQEALPSIDDTSLLRKFALVEDTFGQSSSHAYVTLVSALEKLSPLPTDFLIFLQRGLDVSLRDGDLAQAAWFVSKLQAAGHEESVSWLGTKPAGKGESTTIPGGAKALMFLVLNREQSSPRRLLAEYCQAIIGIGESSEKSIRPESIATYFREIRALQSYGRRTGNSVAVEVSLKSKDSRQVTGKILRLLGWEMHLSREGPTLTFIEKHGSAVRQDTARALGIDLVSTERALRLNGSLRFDIIDEQVPVLLNEAAWKSQFYPKENLPGGFAEAIARDARIAKLYLSLDAMGEQAASALAGAVGLKTLAERNGDLLTRYSSALAVTGGQTFVPGGKDAEPFWERLAGAKPAEPARFFKALLQKDDGRLLAYFFALAQLDSKHQGFFTRTQARMSKLYELFAYSPDVKFGGSRGLGSSPFSSFLAELPLDDEGHIIFPGSTEVWTVANGDDSSTRKTAKLLSDLSKTPSPKAEDEILFRLARTSYKVKDGGHSELGNFLAVARLDACRTEPLDDASALMLAQAFEEYEQIWPYFSTLTGLGRQDFTQFLALGEKLRQLDRPQRNRVWGEVHSLLELLCQARSSSALDDKRSTALFSLLCRRFNSAGSDADFATASLDIVHELLIQIFGSVASLDPDGFMRRLLLGPAMPPVEMESHGRKYILDGARARYENYQRILDLQHVPQLATLFALYYAAQDLSSGVGDSRRHLDVIDAALKSIPGVELPKKLRLNGEATKILESFVPRGFSEISGLLRQTLLPGNLIIKDVKSLGSELLGKINPQVQLALSGLIYAVYLNPSDLLVSEDPLLLRKHEFIKLGGETSHDNELLATNLVQAENTETHLTGGFANPAEMAGLVATAGAKKADEKCLPFMSAQIGFIRSTRWEKIRDRDLRLVGLSVLTAREWIVHSATSASHQADLADATLGLLSVSRRASLLRALNRRDWPTVWQSVTLSDLYSLGNEYIRRYKIDAWYSPTIQALRLISANNADSRRKRLEPPLGPLIDWSDPHPLRLAPYERYEGLLIPDRLAMRVSELKLYLAEYMDREGLPSAALGELAEPVAQGIFRALQLTDFHDWRTVNAAYASLDDSSIRIAVEKP